MNTRTATKHDAAQREPSYPRDELIIRGFAQRIVWRIAYDKALLAAGPPGGEQISASKRAA